MTTAERPNGIVTIPPPVWMLAMFAAAFGIDEFVLRIPIARLPAATLVLAAAGIALDVWAWLQFVRAGTEILPASASNKRLVTAGPFRFSRNPMYLGLLLLASGIAFYAGTLPYFLVPALMFLLCDRVFVPFEEAKMHRQFGAQYTDYCVRVRRWL